MPKHSKTPKKKSPPKPKSTGQKLREFFGLNTGGKNQGLRGKQLNSIIDSATKGSPDKTRARKDERPKKGRKGAY